MRTPVPSPARAACEAVAILPICSTRRIAAALGVASLSMAIGTAGRNIGGSGRLRSTLIRSAASPLAGARPASKRQKRYSCAIGRSAGLTRTPAPRPAMSSLRSRTKATAKAKPSRSWAVTLIKNRACFWALSRRRIRRRQSLPQRRLSRSASGSASGYWCASAFNLNATRNRQMCAPPLASIHLPQWLQLTSSKPPSLSRLIRRRTEAANRSTKESAMMMARVIIECSHH